MFDIVGPLLQWLNQHPQLAGLVTFIISAGESVAILGTIVPGSIMMTALGTLAGAGVIPLWSTLFWAILGAICGDGISYWFGHYFRDRIRTMWPFSRHPQLLITGEKFFHRYGCMSVFIGRFIGPVRALVPLVAGMLGMKPLRFTLANIASAIGWAPLYMLPGILLGAASLELPPDIAIHVMLVLLMIGLFIMMCLWFIYKLFGLIANKINQLQTKIWHSFKNSKHFYGITTILKHHDTRKPHGQLSLAFFLFVTAILLVSLAIYLKLMGPNHIAINEISFHFFRGIHTEKLDHLMLLFTILGQKEVILPVILALFAWFIFCKHWSAAFHALALGILASGSVFVIKNLFQSPRPPGILNSPETFSLPSGHATLSMTVLMGTAFLIAHAVRPRYRKFIYLVALTLAVLIGCSRLYLGAHWFTDIICAWLLSAAVLIFVIISYQRQNEKRVNPWATLVIACLTLIIGYGIFYHQHFSQLKIDYQQVHELPSSLTMEEWWQTGGHLPAYRANLFGFPSQLINVEWVGTADEIKATLLADKWDKPPARDWISTLHRIADVSSTQYLPLISPQYLDKKPELILTRRTKNNRGLLILRLWDANRIIEPTHQHLWVGIVGFVPRSYGWLYGRKHLPHRTTPDIHFSTISHMWQQKLIKIIRQKNERAIEQNILLIRPAAP